MKRNNTFILENQSKNKIQKLNEVEEQQEEEEDTFLTLFDTNLIQNIFIQLFKKYKYKLQKKLYISMKNFTNLKEEDYKKYFFKLNNFPIVCSLFNNISKQTLFNLNIYNIKFQIPYNLYFKLSFVERKVEMCEEENQNIDSMLYFSCVQGFYGLISILIKKGKADINDQINLKTPLFKATESNYVKTIKVLFKYKNLDINLTTDFARFTPLMEACRNNFEDIVSLFLSRNDLDINKQDDRDRTALIHAAKFDHENIVSLILSRNDLNLNIQSDRGYTALMYATIYNYENIVSLLLSRNELNLNLKDNKGFTALMKAVEYQDENIVSLLLSQKNRININLKDNNQKTALDHAKQKKNQKIIEMIQNYEKD